jgi:6-phosphogluconolactonase
LKKEIQVLPDSDDVSKRGAEIFCQTAIFSVNQHGNFAVAISGGSTPRPMHRLLSQRPLHNEIPWHRTHIFWIDERLVAVDNPHSNFGTAKKDFLDNIPIPSDQIHPMPAMTAPEKGAELYEKELKTFFRGLNSNRPVFDLVILGVGKDGHIASLFPGNYLKIEPNRWVLSVKGGNPDVYRLTLTYVVLNYARHILFLVSGKEKARIVKTLFEDGQTQLPVSLVEPLAGQVTWLLDKAAASLLQGNEIRTRTLATKKEKNMTKDNYASALGEFEAVVKIGLDNVEEKDILQRIWDHDHTVWKDDPTEISNRLGWLHSPENMVEEVELINDFVDGVRGEGFTHALLLGMGGSSLAPEVLRLTFGVKDGYIDLSVLDSTDPGAVQEKVETLDFSKTLFIISTKSGGTVETFSFMKFFYNETLEAVGQDRVGGHFVAITDPGSGLESMGKELKFRKIFLNDPNIGGRYSALSFFGLVPAALIGMDLNLILKRAGAMAQHTRNYNCPVHGINTAAQLGVTLGEAALAGRDKITFIISPRISYFGAWVEQLIAESTGKEGRGILPVSGENVGAPAVYAHDRMFVYLRVDGDSRYDKDVQMLEDDGRPVVRINLGDLYDLGGEFFRWEMATVIAGMRLGINPFDQPNVESAKILARNLVSAYQNEGRLPELTPGFQTGEIQVYSDFTANSIRDTFKKFFSFAKPGEDDAAGRSYVSIQAYIKPGRETDEALQNLRAKIQQGYRMAVTVGYGPRFLHSTGQLHKGDAGHGMFIQLLSDTEKDLSIPAEPGDSTSSITFGVLKRAQALGDRQALLDAGRQVVLFDVGKDVLGAIETLTDDLDLA